MRRMIFPMLICLFVNILAACGGDSDSPAPSQPLSTDPHSAQKTLSPVLIELQREYELLQDSYKALSDIWEGLATGQEVQCGSYPPVPNPDGIHAEDDPTYEPLAETLRRAAIDLDHALTVWKAECNSTRPTPSPDVINEGRLAVRAAGDTLKNAEPLLSEIQ